MALIDFTLSNARRFYSSMGNEPLGSERVTNTRQDKLMPHVDCVNCLYIFHGNKAGEDLGGGAEAAAPPPLSVRQRFFFFKIYNNFTIL